MPWVCVALKKKKKKKEGRPVTLRGKMGKDLETQQTEAKNKKVEVTLRHS